MRKWGKGGKEGERGRQMGRGETGHERRERERMDKGSGKKLLAAGKVRGKGRRGSKGQCGMVVACGPGARLHGPRSQLLRLSAAPMSVLICTRGCGQCLLLRAPCTSRTHRMDSTDYRCSGL